MWDVIACSRKSLNSITSSNPLKSRIHTGNQDIKIPSATDSFSYFWMIPDNPFLLLVSRQ